MPPATAPIGADGAAGDDAAAATVVDVTWIPVDHLDDPAVAEAMVTAPLRAHDAKSLMRSLLAAGIDSRGLRLDTAIAAYLARPGRRPATTCATSSSGSRRS
ncbi:MAG: hypothetical protein WKF58_00550 [Ilumatobacteraceae bacterium]